MNQTEQTSQTIKLILNARSVAIVGASGEPHKFGYMTLNSIIQGGYEGKIYPVNPKGGEIFGLKVYESLKRVPDPLDLVVVIVPAELVPGVLTEAGQKGVPGAMILSAGFREAGRTDLEAEISSISKEYGLRLMGPNIQGINYLSNKLCAMFFPVITTPGPLAIISQSGTITAALSEWAEGEGLGISAAVNLGNQVDLCESDYLEFFASDDSTKAIALYLEGVKNGRRFLDALKRTVAKKPVAILKSGRTVSGQRSVASHTGSLAAGNEVFNGACRQLGIINVEDLESLYDSAKALALIKSPRGKRLLTISTSGGACTLAVDEAETLGLEIPSLSEEFVFKLKQLKLSPLASLSNPIDLASISVDHFRQVLELADQFDMADIILLNFGDPVPGVPAVLHDFKNQIKASLVVSYMGGGEEEKSARIELQRNGIPVFPTPERAVQGIFAVTRAAGFPEGRFARISLADKVPNGNKPAQWSGHRGYDPNGTNGRFIPESEAIKILEPYRIVYPDHGLARGPEEAVALADRLSYPVVLKVVSPDVVHKTDVGGVVTGLKDSEQVRGGYEQIKESVLKTIPEAKWEGALVCKEIPAGMDLIIGALEDPVFGKTIMFGLGGIFTEVLRDVSFRLIPLTRKDAIEMVAEIKGSSLLLGFRGQPAYNLEPLYDLLLSISRMLTDQPEIKELDLNPVRIFREGVVALDVRLIKNI